MTEAMGAAGGFGDLRGILLEGGAGDDPLGDFVTVCLTPVAEDDLDDPRSEVWPVARARGLYSEVRVGLITCRTGLV